LTFCAPIAASIRSASKRCRPAPSNLGVLNCKGVASLLARKNDNAAAKDSRPATLFDHANLRGPGYYH
jgi:hypothetical protein